MTGRVSYNTLSTLVYKIIDPSRRSELYVYLGTEDNKTKDHDRSLKATTQNHRRNGDNFLLHIKFSKIC